MELKTRSCSECSNTFSSFYPWSVNPNLINIWSAISCETQNHQPIMLRSPYGMVDWALICEVFRHPSINVYSYFYIQMDSKNFIKIIALELFLETDDFSMVSGHVFDPWPFLGDVGLCSLSMEVGNCKAKVVRYFFNQEVQECEPFVYSGCGGNANKFVSRSKCQEHCMVDHHRMMSGELPSFTYSDSCHSVIKLEMKFLARFSNLSFKKFTGTDEKVTAIWVVTIRTGASCNACEPFIKHEAIS